MAVRLTPDQRVHLGDQLDAPALALQQSLDLAAGIASTFSLPPDSLVMGFGATRPYTPNNSLLAEIHAPAEIGIIMAGATERYFPKWHCTTAAGDVWMHGMWEPHGWQVLLPETARVVVAFLPEFLGEETVRGMSWWSLFAVPPAERPRVTPENRPRVLALARELHEEIESAAPDWQVPVRLLVLQLLQVLSREWTPPAVVADRPPQKGSCLGRLIPVLILIKDRGGKEVSLADAAEACELRRSQFSKEFRRTLGVTFGQFRLRVQLAAAARQLLTTDLPVSAVAARAGFSDASHLNRAFARHYGCTPGKYRAQTEQAKVQPPA